MQQYKLINNIAGWIVFAIALVVYTLTLESTASFWDCGEFISGAYKLQVVHPPGAPLFLLIGRVFTLFAPGPESVAYMINFMSGLSSALGILFLFWITTALARKVVFKKGEAPSMEQILAVIGTGAVAALACTFSDTYWFSAVEGEVYALSTFFIVLVFWCIMKWEASEDGRFKDKWIVLAAFFVGLSVGVHLMSLLAIPAMSLVYYFKKYEPSWKGAIIALLAGFGILMFVFVGIVSVMIGVLAKLDFFFVNSMGLPFGSGAVTITVLIVGTVVGGLFYAHKTHHLKLETAMLSLAMVLIGFTSYAAVVIRAQAIPPIDMNRPADIFRLQSYLNREQYGDRPLLYGPHYNAYPTKINKTGKKYYKGEDKYIPIGDRISYEFNDKDMMLFPRLGSWQDDRHVRAYRAMLGLKKDEDPSFADNIGFFVNYQIGFMWFRYFMWNFSGRQNDIQGRFDNHNGKWISGIPFIDQMHLGPQDTLTDELKNNKARNKFYMIPLILGLIGFFYHYKKNQTDALVIITLFLFTGLIEIIFFNSPPFEPRERDYTLVGSFVTFTIWIGFAVLAIYEFLRTKVPGIAGAGLAILLAMVAPVLMAKDGWDDHDRSGRYTARDFAINYLESCAPNAVLFTQGDNDTYPLWYAQEVEGIRPDIRVVNLSLLGVDWYIEQLQYAINEAPPVKLIHTPDKYLGNRRDVTRYFDSKRIPQDRYIELDRVVKFVASDDKKTQVQVTGGEFINYMPTKKFKIDVDSATVVANNVVPEGLRGKIVKEMRFEVNKNNVLKNDLITLDILASNLWERPIYFAVSVSPDSYLGLQKYFQLEGLAYRVVPVASSTSGGQNGFVSSDLMYENIMNDFRWGEIDKKKVVEHTVQTGETLESIGEEYDFTAFEISGMNGGIENVSAGEKVKLEMPNDLYLDENILRMTMNLRSNFARLVDQLIAEGKSEKAEKALDYCIESLPRQTVPYNLFMVRFPELYYRIDKKEKARNIMRELAENYEQELLYYNSVSDYDPSSKRSIQQAFAVIQELLRIAQGYKDNEMQDELTNRLSDLRGQLSIPS